MPGVREELNGAALARWARLCLDGLDHHRDEINALNVFPVADADTGTNLLATMRAAVVAAEAVPGVVEGAAEVGGAEGSVRAVAAAMARAATAGARGNSGIILSQVLRGIAEAVVSEPLTAATLRVALRRAAVLVREALSEPVEGTMLTVLDAAADRAGDCAEETLAAVAQAAADGASKALGDTPSQLSVLRAAGVVDAGARGLLVLLDALVTEVTGQVPARPAYAGSERVPAPGQARPTNGRRPLPPDENSPRRRDAVDWSARFEQNVAAVPPPDGIAASTAGPGGCALETTASPKPQGKVATAVDPAARATIPARPGAEAGQAVAAVFRGGVGEGSVARPQYEVMYLLTGTEERRIDALRDSLARLGDSVVVVGDGDGTWSAHVHCADAGAAVEAGLAAGQLSGIRIEGLAVSSHAEDGAADRGILAVVTGAGAARLFEDAGAVVLEGEVTADALLSAIRNMPHREVVVLPNGALPAHELVAVSVAARDGRRDVLMLPSGSMVQGLAALALHDGGRTAADDVFAMSEAAAATRWGALRVARERALTIVGTCERGDGLGLVGNDVVVIDADAGAAARTLLDRMLGLGGELVTLLLGADAPPGLGEELTEHITVTFPGVEVITYTGGQAADLVQIGVE
nr:DAK2 domain-containing protein [Nocardia blacklockiae]